MHKKKVFIVTDKVLFDLGYTHEITENLTKNNIEFKIFSEVEPDPTLKAAKKGAEVMRNFGPDVIMAIGGGFHNGYSKNHVGYV